MIDIRVKGNLIYIIGIKIREQRFEKNLSYRNNCFLKSKWNVGMYK